MVCKLHSVLNSFTWNNLKKYYSFKKIFQCCFIMKLCHFYSKIRRHLLLYYRRSDRTVFNVWCIKNSNLIDIDIKNNLYITILCWYLIFFLNFVYCRNRNENIKIKLKQERSLHYVGNRTAVILKAFLKATKS